MSLQEDPYFSVGLVKLFIPKQVYVMRGYFDQEVKKSRCLVNLSEVVCAMLLLYPSSQASKKKQLQILALTIREKSGFHAKKSYQ